MRKKKEDAATRQARLRLKAAAVDYVNAQKAPERGRFANKFPVLEGRGVQQMHPRIVNVSLDVSQEVAAALRELRGTGLYGNGVDCASVAEELLRWALRQPAVEPHWRKP